MVAIARLLALSLLLALLAAPVAAEPLEIDELLAIPWVSDVATSPRGVVAWVENASGRDNVFVAAPPYDAPRQVTEFTADDGQEISIVGFAQGDRRLILRRGRDGFNPAHLPEPPEAKLLALSLADGALERLDGPEAPAKSCAAVSPDGGFVAAARGGGVWSTDLETGRVEKLFEARGWVCGLHYSPDGSKLAFVSDRSGYERGKYSFVGVYDRAATRVTYMSPGVGFDQSTVWSPDGERIAFVRFGYEPKTWRFSNHLEGAPFSIVVADATTGKGAEIWTSEPGYGSRFNGFRASGYSGLGGSGNLSWLADDTLVFPYEKTGWKHLYAVPADGGEPRALTKGTFEVDGAAMAPDRQSLLYWASSEDDPHRLGLYRLALGEVLPERIGSAGTDMRFGARFASPEVLLYFHADALVPERLVLRRASGEELQLSSGPRPGDPITRKGAEAELVSFPSLDGLEIPAILYRPDDPEQNRGLVVHAHGGSRSKVYPVWSTYFGYPKVLQYLRSLGYFVLTVNYRSGIGYGLDFREPESYGGRGAGDVQDFLAAARWARGALPQVDPERTVIFGHSYGGHIVSNALARSDDYAAGIDSAGVGDWVTEMEKDFGEVLQFGIPARLELEKLAFESSAISKIDRWGDEPVLFLHGDNDGSAAMQQTLELYLALKRRGKDARALIFPGESHGINLERNQALYLEAIEEFLQTVLPRPTGSGSGGR
ncbi:MAG: prolyl oligopeptidase family serine peptidase [Acidobacteriota bacterium]